MRPPSAAPRSSRSPPPKHGRSSPRRRQSATLPAGPSPSPSGCARARRWASDGTTSTSTRRPCPSGAHCSGTRAAAWSSEPKSPAGRRTVVLPQPLVTALRRHRVAQHEERLAAGSIWTDNGFVFTTSRGTPIDPRADHRSWQALLSRSGVRPARLHDARHTAATLLLSQGVPARVAMQILGHSQISLTLGTYSHVVPELAHEAAERMAGVLWDIADGDTGEMAARKAAHTEKRGDEPESATPLTWENVVRREGLEPPTRGLRVRCSAS